MPRILDDELFYKVQERMEKNKHAKAHSRAKEEYLLTTKLFCGHCKEMMIGYSGTGRKGKIYHYYICKKARKKLCDKKVIDKNYIEDKVVEECIKLLDDNNIKYIAKRISEECENTVDSIVIKDLKKKIKELEKAISNLFTALEQGTASD